MLIFHLATRHTSLDRRKDSRRHKRKHRFKTQILDFFFHMILLKSSYISGFDHISSQNGWFTSQK